MLVINGGELKKKVPGVRKKMSTFLEVLDWYWNLMFGSMLYSIVIILVVVSALAYYARCKKQYLRSWCASREMSIEISV